MLSGFEKARIWIFLQFAHHFEKALFNSFLKGICESCHSCTLAKFRGFFLFFWYIFGNCFKLTISSCTLCETCDKSVMAVINGCISGTVENFITMVWIFYIFDCFFLLKFYLFEELFQWFFLSLWLCMGARINNLNLGCIFWLLREKNILIIWNLLLILWRLCFIMHILVRYRH